MEATTSQTIECEIRIEAAPETVFEFFTDPAKAALWMGQRATLDPRPGGIYKLEMTNAWTVVGEYVEVDPPNRVVFTWGWESGVEDTPPGSTTVEITLTRDGDATLVHLIHRDLPTERSVGAHRAGWDKFLPRLTAVAEGRDPGPDPHQEATP